MNNQRNLVIAVLLSALILFGWDFAMSRLYPQPASMDRAERIDTPVERAAGVDGETRDGGLADPADIAEKRIELETALATTNRVAIRAPAVIGSINPAGARIDDIELTTHRETVDRDSGPVRLFSPSGTIAQQFAQFGWVGQGVEVPDAQTVWQAQGGPLAPGSPVMLTWNNGQGQVFRITLTIDERYMITAQQTVENTGDSPVVVQPYAFINRTSRTASQDTWNVHSGPIGAFDGSVDFGWDYDDVAEAGTVRHPGSPNWAGFTDIYWLSALVPQQGADAETAFRALGGDAYRADVLYQPVTVPAGQAVTRTTGLFAGAKESATLDAYEDAGIANFGLAIDWGWFRWFEKPIFWLLRTLYELSGNFGVAIILLTLIIRLLMFPIAQKQFASMASMRAIQPKMKELQDRYKDDKPKAQQEIMALYKKEGVNPLAGCLPILVQIPIFFALYKVLMLAIEMRHKPFVLWIRDLSAPDPAMILNLFGLLDFTPPSFLAIGILALLLGLTMFLQFRLNPSAMDPVQQQMFMIMPWVLMFVMAPFAAGLLLYWITSNILTLAQQKYLYSKHPQLKAAQPAPKVEPKAKVKG
ncbi:membrane protein insertase YidC [Altericroceibacterium xinjiangense]|uniref:membrane protein insertase YidC n=1 Tax=Altericroceibacterium xinjiangense TaxID=762261 RepID=UPI000F7E0ABD|nr:membrane protein insertase YidC [Altericroceibacterium xinjiangense]